MRTLPRKISRVTKEDTRMIDNTEEEMFAQKILLAKTIDNYINIAHEMAVSKGFWDTPETDAGLIALMHSELSEALEGLRHGNPMDSHCPEFTSVEVEMADVFIRICDYSGAKGLRLAEAIKAKMLYNASRPYKHGKKF